jgi:hypothetical protein
VSALLVPSLPEADFTWLAEISLWQVAVVIVAIYIIFRLLIKFWPWLRKVMALTQALVDLPGFIVRTDKTLDEQNKKIDEIHHEVHFNDGSSMKDAVVLVQKEVALLSKPVAARRSKPTNT